MTQKLQKFSKNHRHNRKINITINKGLQAQRLKNALVGFFIAKGIKLYYNHKQKPQAYFFCLSRPVIRYRNGKRFPLPSANHRRQAVPFACFFSGGRAPFRLPRATLRRNCNKKDSLCPIIGPRATSTRFHPKAGLVGERLTGRKPFFGQRFSPLFPPQTPPFSPFSL